MKKKTLWWIVGGSVLLLIILIAIGKSGDNGTKVAVEKAALHTITETVAASGKIYPETEVKISPEVSGEIIELTVEEGDSVQAEQLLVRINPAIYTSLVNQARASVQQAKANYDQARANYNRNRRLYRDKIISAMEYEQLESAYRNAKAAYESSTASLNQANENLRKTTILAPTAGVISALNVKLGERVVGTAQMAGTEMFTIADLSKIEVRVDVSETDIAKVRLGNPATIEADAYRDRKFQGVVSKISVSSKAMGLQQVSTDQVTNYTVHILIDSNSYADLMAKMPNRFPFKPGMSASVEIQTKNEKDILSIPVNAVTTRDYPDSVKKKTLEDTRQVVFVYDEKEGNVSIRDVETGIQDNQYIQIRSGLKAGEQVVIAPYGAIARTLKDKSVVNVVDKKNLYEGESGE